MADQQDTVDSFEASFTLRLPQAVADELKRIADERGSKVAVVAREAVFFYIRHRRKIEAA